MKFDQPATPNPIDQERVVTRPHTRIEGPLKVTGQAPYAYEYQLPEAPTYGFVVGAGIARGKIRSIDTAAAEAAPGVLLVLTHENMPAQGASDTPVPQQEDASPQLAGPEVRHYHQAVAFVVAGSFEEARAAASLIEVEYEVTPGQFTLADTVEDGKEPDDAVDSVVGHFEEAFGAADVTVDLTFTTPDQSQAPMEPHATIAHWDGDQLTVHTAHQIVHWVKRGLALTLKIPQKNVRVISAYVGGGFGTKLLFFSDAVLSAAAAKVLGRPVKTTLQRPLIFNNTSHRAATIQRVRLGADHAGNLSAVGHDTWTGNLPGGDSEPACEQTKYLYAGPNRQIRTRQSELDLPPGASMRAPGEAVGMLAIEGAMDELAEKLGVDPVELRLMNDVQFDPEKGPKRPFSSRKLAQSLRTGARAFGWEGRPHTPQERRDGEWFIGYGVASAFRTNLVKPSGATIRLEPGGTLTVETQMTDIGTGSYTILRQVAAGEAFGEPAVEAGHVVRLPLEGGVDGPQAGVQRFQAVVVEGNVGAGPVAAVVTVNVVRGAAQDDHVPRLLQGHAQGAQVDQVAQQPQRVRAVQRAAGRGHLIGRQELQFGVVHDGAAGHAGLAGQFGGGVEGQAGLGGGRGGVGHGVMITLPVTRRSSRSRMARGPSSRV